MNWQWLPLERKEDGWWKGGVKIHEAVSVSPTFLGDDKIEIYPSYSQQYIIFDEVPDFFFEMFLSQVYENAKTFRGEIINRFLCTNYKFNKLTDHQRFLLFQGFAKASPSWEIYKWRTNGSKIIEDHRSWFYLNANKQPENRNNAYISSTGDLYSGWGEICLCTEGRETGLRTETIRGTSVKIKEN